MNPGKVIDINIVLRDFVSDEIIKDSSIDFFPLEIFDFRAKEFFFQDQHLPGYIEIRNTKTHANWKTEIIGEINPSSCFPDFKGTFELKVLNFCIFLNIKTKSDILTGNNITKNGEFLLIKDFQIIESFENPSEEYFDVYTL